MYDQPIQRTEAFLRQLAAEAPEGSRLVTVRECMRLNGVSKVVVDRAVAKLHGEKVIEVRPRSGLYKPVVAKGRKRVINLLHYSTSTALYSEQQLAMNFHGELLLALNLTMAAIGWQPAIHMMACETEPEAVVSSLLADRIDVVVMFCLTNESFHHLRRFEEAGVKVYNVLPNMIETMPRTLRLDDFAIVRQQLEYLTGFGLRRIAYLHSGVDGGYNRAQHARLDSFCRMALEFRLDVAPAWVCASTWDGEDINNHIDALLRDGGTPEAMIINDGHVKGVYSALRRHGLEPGRDIAVIGCDDMPWAQFMDPGLSTVRISRHCIVEKLCDLIRSESDVSVAIPTTLVERGSTRRFRAEMQPDTL